MGGVQQKLTNSQDWEWIEHTLNSRRSPPETEVFLLLDEFPQILVHLKSHFFAMREVGYLNLYKYKCDQNHSLMEFNLIFKLYIYIYILSLNIVNRKREIITNFKEFI